MMFQIIKIKTKALHLKAMNSSWMNQKKKIVIILFLYSKFFNWWKCNLNGYTSEQLSHLVESVKNFKKLQKASIL